MLDVLICCEGCFPLTCPEIESRKAVVIPGRAILNVLAGPSLPKWSPLLCCNVL